MLSRLLPLISACLAVSLGAAEPPELNDEGLDFLVLVDTSYSMAPQKDATIGSVRGLVESGFQQQIRPGDKFTIWTFNQKVLSRNFPPQTWDPAHRELYAEMATQYLAPIKPERKTSFDALLTEMGRLPGLSTNLLVILFTDGEQEISGTPFDMALNAVFATQAKRLKELQRPFVISFLIQEGRFTQPKVFFGQSPISLPELRPSPKPKVAQKTPPKPASTGVPKATLPPIVKTEAKNDAVPTVFEYPPGAVINGITSLPVAEPAPVSPQTANPLVQQTPPPPIRSSAPALPQTQQPKTDIVKKPAPVAPNVHVTHTASAPVTKPGETKIEPPAASTAIASETNTTQAVSTLAAPPAESTPRTSALSPVVTLAQSGSINALWFVLGGFACVGVLACGLFLKNARRRHQPSLISQSLTGK